MNMHWGHFIWILALGYALGYWMPKLGDMTLAKVYPRS
jgi:hypothetical protein